MNFEFKINIQIILFGKYLILKNDLKKSIIKIFSEKNYEKKYKNQCTSKSREKIPTFKL